jgi:MscS family membrane protein
MMKLPLNFGLILIILTCLPAVTLGQEPVAEQATEIQPVPEEHASARATMQTFIEAFYRDEGHDLAAAAACLDTSDLPFGPGSIKADELAVKLKEVLDRTRLVEFEEISDDPEGPEYVFLRQAEGQVAISRLATGEWLFDRETVKTLDDLHRELEEEEVVEGVEIEAPEAVSPATWLRGQVSEGLRGQVLFLEGWQWIGLLIVLVLGVVIGQLFSIIVSGVILRIIRRTVKVVDTQLLATAIRPAGALVMVLVWGIGIAILGLPVGMLNIYYRAVWIVGVLAAVVTTYRLVDVGADIMKRRAAETVSRYDDLLVPLIRKSVKVFVFAVGLILVAQQIGANVAGLIAGLGLGGLAFALAAQDTVSNLFGSLTVLADRPFQVGDWIVTGNVEGTVEEVGFRSTRIRTFYNSLITLPNSNLTNAAVDNLGERTYRRWSTRIGVAYETPPEKIDAFCEGVRELIRRHPYTRKDYFHVYLNELGASALEVLLYVFFQTPDWATELRERHRLGVDILRLARELDVELAYPSQTLFVRQPEWQAPLLAEDGYAKGKERISGEAREQAQQLVDGVLGGSAPPPVTFDVPPEQDGGDSGE